MTQQTENTYNQLYISTFRHHDMLELRHCAFNRSKRQSGNTAMDTDKLALENRMPKAVLGHLRDWGPDCQNTAHTLHKICTRQWLASAIKREHSHE